VKLFPAYQLSSLFCRGISCKEKRFIKLALALKRSFLRKATKTGENLNNKKNFFPSPIMLWQSKLERLRKTFVDESRSLPR
jgi:hypothetical protein